MRSNTVKDGQSNLKNNKHDSMQLRYLIEKRYLNKKEAATYCGISYNTLQKFIHGGLKVVRIDSLVRIDRHDIDDFFDHNKK